MTTRQPALSGSIFSRPPIRSGLLWATAVGVLAFAVYQISLPGATPYIHYVRLADALLHGRVDLPDSPSYIEVTTYQGRHYVMPPPFPAILLLPYVALRGFQANQALASHLIGGVAAAAMVLVASRLMPKPADYLWLGVFGAFGTIIWHLSAVGSTWYFAHVIVVAALTLGVLETLSRQRPLLLGMAVATAFWTRQPAIFTLPFFCFATSSKWAPGGLRAWRRIELGYLIRLAAPIAVAVLLNMGYNFIRFGTPADVAMALRPGIFEESIFLRGLFHPSYIPRHLAVIFAYLPRFIHQPPYLLVPLAGLAIWVTSPAFVFALLAPARLETLAAWLGICAVAAVDFSFGNPGFTQFGYRFATDFYPLLFLLTIRGMGERVPVTAKVLIGLGVLVNLWGVVWTRWGWLAP